MNINNFEYLILLLIAGLPTFLLSLHPKSEIKKDRLLAIKSILLVIPAWLVWDFYATVNNHWGFNYNYVLGPSLFYLPLEEIGFFIVIPFSCLYLWCVIRDFESFEILKNKLLNKD